MGDIMAEFDDPNFNVDKYTKQLVKECVGGIDLQKCKKDIQDYSDVTSTTLKKSVYANYMQFIETSKEISNLETEMAQLSVLLQEQHNILGLLTDDKTSAKSKDDEDGETDAKTQQEMDNMHATRAVKEMVQGFNGNLEGKTFLNEGALTELDCNDYRPIQRVFFFLFNDVLIICKVKHDKRLEFIAEYDPRRIGVINIRDLDGVKNAINIRTPDGSKIFQSITAAGKTEWIEQLDIAFRWDQLQKKNKVFSDQQQNRSTEIISPTNTLNPSAPLNTELTPSPEWTYPATDEIQTYIAQRNFEDAETLIRKCQDYINVQQNANSPSLPLVEEKIIQLEKQLVDMLLLEITKCQSRNLQVALKSSKRCLHLLVKMGKARQACGSLLKICSIAIRNAQREARKNNTSVSELFFCDLAQVTCAFVGSFESQPACISALIVWCNTELQYFATQLRKHYLTNGCQLEFIAQCVEEVRVPCAQLTEIGLDLSYHLEGLLRSDLEELIHESKIRLLETIGRSEELWQPFNLHTKSNLKRVLSELDKSGVDMRQHTTGDTWINLTQSTINFTRHYMQLTNHCASLAKSEGLSQSCQLLLKDVLMAQYSIKPSPILSVDPNFVLKNRQFLVEELLPIALNKFHGICGTQAANLIKFQNQLRNQVAPVPKKRSIYHTGVF